LGGLPKFELVCEYNINHGIPDNKISFCAGGDGKGVSEARNNGCVYSGQCLTWRGIGDPRDSSFSPSMSYTGSGVSN